MTEGFGLMRRSTDLERGKRRAASKRQRAEHASLDSHASSAGRKEISAARVVGPCALESTSTRQLQFKSYTTRADASTSKTGSVDAPKIDPFDLQRCTLIQTSHVAIVLRLQICPKNSDCSIAFTSTTMRPRSH